MLGASVTVGAPLLSTNARAMTPMVVSEMTVRASAVPLRAPGSTARRESPQPSAIGRQPRDDGDAPHADAHVRLGRARHDDEEQDDEAGPGHRDEAGVQPAAQPDRRPGDEAGSGGGDDAGRPGGRQEEPQVVDPLAEDEQGGDPGRHRRPREHGLGLPAVRRVEGEGAEPGKPCERCQRQDRRSQQDADGAG